MKPDYIDYPSVEYHAVNIEDKDSANFFEYVPHEILYNVFDFLDAGSLAKLDHVNSRFHSVSNGDKLWARRSQIDFPQHQKHGQHWKLLYKEDYEDRIRRRIEEERKVTIRFFKLCYIMVTEAFFPLAMVVCLWSLLWFLEHDLDNQLVSVSTVSPLFVALAYILLCLALTCWSQHESFPLAPIDNRSIFSFCMQRVLRNYGRSLLGASLIFVQVYCWLVLLALRGTGTISLNWGWVFLPLLGAFVSYLAGGYAFELWDYDSLRDYLRTVGIMLVLTSPLIAFFILLYLRLAGWNVSVFYVTTPFWLVEILLTLVVIFRLYSDSEKCFRVCCILSLVFVAMSPFISLQTLFAVKSHGSDMSYRWVFLPLYIILSLCGIGSIFYCRSVKQNVSNRIY